MPRHRRDVPWIEWRGGIAYAVWYDPAAKSNRRLSLRTADPVEAARRFGEFLLHGQEIRDPSRVSGLTVSAALDDYLKEHVAKHVIDWQRQEDAATHLRAGMGALLLRDVDIPRCRAYAEARRAGGTRKRASNERVSDATIRRELGVLKAAAHHAVRWKRITLADMPTFELPAETREEATYLTRQELQRALSMAPTQKLHDFIMLAYYTAARRRSIERLTRFQVDLERGRINLRSPTEDALKRRSKKRRPVVPIHNDLRPTIERLLLQEGEWLLSSPADMYKPFAAHLRSIGLDSKAFPHVLRHSRATHLLQDGVSLYDVAKLLGDTVATVERVYGHHCPDYLNATIQKVTER